jgi:hypothetical protein
MPVLFKSQKLCVYQDKSSNYHLTAYSAGTVEGISHVLLPLNLTRETSLCSLYRQEHGCSEMSENLPTSHGY